MTPLLTPQGPDRQVWVRPLIIRPVRAVSPARRSRGRNPASVSKVRKTTPTILKFKSLPDGIAKADTTGKKVLGKKRKMADGKTKDNRNGTLLKAGTIAQNVKRGTGNSYPDNMSRPVTDVSPSKTASLPKRSKRDAMKQSDDAKRGKTAIRKDNSMMTTQMAQWVERYCKSNSQNIAITRLAWQRQQLNKAKSALEERVAKLEEKIKAYKSLLDQDERQRRAIKNKVVRIFSAMRPDAAAVQLSTMAEESARGVLALMETKRAGLILNEMKAPKAAKLAELLIAKPVRGKDQPDGR